MFRLILLFTLISSPVLAAVQSETIFFVQPDGEHYLLERSIHSDSASHTLHLPKSVRLEDLRHVSPAHFDWDNQTRDDVNALSFDAGGFTVIYPAKFNTQELKVDRDGIHHYKSWDGQRSANGMYGYWYSTGQFDRFSYTWILPPNIEVTRYRSNQSGTWTRRDQAISFYAEKVNNLTFQISFRVISKPNQPARSSKPVTQTEVPATPKAVVHSAPTTPRPPAPVKPRFQLGDSDKDGIDNAHDLCPDTPQNAITDRTGCAFDTDADGVPDGVDQCPASEEGGRVNAAGCSV